jgi:outer membrane protein assembly factor BamB
MRASFRIIAVCVVVVLGIGVARLWHQEPESVHPDVPYSASPRANLTPAQELELERIATLGYVVGTEPTPARSGVLRHLPDEAFAGFTLYTSAEDPYSVLLDMGGNVVHSWQYPGSEYWSRAHLLQDGGLLAITCGPPELLRLNSDSELVWRFAGHAHHDLAVMSDGTICVLVRTSATRPNLNNGEAVIDDCIVLLDAKGRQLSFISLLESFERSTLGEQRLSDHLLPDDPDLFHTNSVEILSEGERLQFLLSIRSISTVAILDAASGRIVWALSGRWHKQHEAQLVDGNILLFDNLGLTKERPELNQSRVLEIDINSLEVVWSFTEPGFFTRGAGAQQRLPNGNTLITESERGRIIEVSPDGRVVWEYVNPATIREQPFLLPGILRAERIPAGFSSTWFAGDRRSWSGDSQKSGTWLRD